MSPNRERPYLDNMNSSSSLTLSSISSAGSNGSRNSSPNNSSILVTLTKTIHSQLSYTITSAPPPAEPAAAATTTSTAPFSPDEKHVEVSGEDDTASEGADAPASSPLSLRLESAVAPRRYTLFNDASGAELSHVVPPVPNAKGHAPEELVVSSSRNNKMATIRNVNPGGNKASKSHVDIHVLGKDGKVVMAVRGTNSRHVVLVGPRGGRSFMGWMSKQDSVDGEDSGTEKWTINLKDSDDLPVVCWMIVAIDEFTEMSQETRAQLAKVDGERSSARCSADLPRNTAATTARKTYRRARARNPHFSKTADEAHNSTDEVDSPGPQTRNHFPEPTPLPQYRMRKSVSSQRLDEATSYTSSDDEHIPVVTAMNLRASKSAPARAGKETDSKGRSRRRRSLDFLRPTSRTDPKEGNGDTKDRRRSIELFESLRNSTKRDSHKKTSRWSLRGRG